MIDSAIPNNDLLVSIYRQYPGMWFKLLTTEWVLPEEAPDNAEDLRRWLWRRALQRTDLLPARTTAPVNPMENESLSLWRMTLSMGPGLEEEIIFSAEDLRHRRADLVPFATVAMDVVGVGYAVICKGHGPKPDAALGWGRYALYREEEWYGGYARLWADKHGTVFDSLMPGLPMGRLAPHQMHDALPSLEPTAKARP